MIEVYRNYLIVGSGIRNDNTGAYFPLAAISWQKEDGSRGAYVLENLSTTFDSREEAAAAAFANAVVWVDQQLSH
jgi:hypothetical protein